jgi:hypothetical protein
MVSEREVREALADELSAELLRIAAEQNERFASWQDAERYRMAARMAYGLDLQVREVTTKKATSDNPLAFKPKGDQ